MSRKILLCEGRTDQILLSYFLHHVGGWAHIRSDRLRSLPKLPQVTPATRAPEWYHRPGRPEGEELAIWSVEGKDNFGRHLAELARLIRSGRPKDPPEFSKIVLVHDHDCRPDGSPEVDEAVVESWLQEAGMIQDRVSNGVRVFTLERGTSPPVPAEVEFMVLRVPHEGPGCLEVFLLQCLARHSDHDRSLVEKAEAYVRAIPDRPYLYKRRYRPKAQLGSVLSVISPDWVFNDLDERLKSIDWAPLLEDAEDLTHLRQL